MSSSQIITARAIITMADAEAVAAGAPVRAEAMAIEDGRIIEIGSLEACRSTAPDAVITDCGDSVILPGFVDVHTHPLLSGMATKPPAIDISPWNVATWDDVVEIGRRAAEEAPPEASIMMFGLDQLLHGCPFPTAAEMDMIFGDRVATIIALCQHQAAITTATMRVLGWLDEIPADPDGGTFGRADDGSMLGTANEIPAVFAVIAPVFERLGGHPLEQGAMYLSEMASVGITAAAETGYVSRLKAGYEALCGEPELPIRMMLYHQLTEPDAADPFVSDRNQAVLCKQGYKIFADGTPWLGTIATSFPYLDTEPVRNSHFPLGLHAGTKALNFTSEEFESHLEPIAESGLQVACHVNGDLAIDMVLDAYERVLSRHGLLDADHRWRVEHIGAVRADQLERMARLGVVPTFGLFQFTQWGDLLDGTMYDSAHGSQWCRIGDAERLGLRQSYHNDGNISRPMPMANVQAAVTRQVNSRRADGTYGFADGKVHGPEQRVTLHEALRAVTINAAYCVKREHEIGSLEVGKFADLVELADDPYGVAPTDIVTRCAVRATWLNGRRTDPDAFVAAVADLENHPDHHELRRQGTSSCNHR